VPIERPTFHESWYRVASLHPRLRSTVQISRQHFRGQGWHVVQDHTNNAFFRLPEPAYRFLGLLNGTRTVAEAWTLTNDQLGDEAPTQGEVIQLLGQLYTSNLLQAEVSPDAHTLFARYKKRRSREITGYLMNILFARIPLVDPDAFLNRWNSLLGLIFSPVGVLAWIALIASAIYAIMSRPNWQTGLTSSAHSILSPENLLWMYIAFAGIKAVHEMGHAISCKKFSKQAGSGGEVHIIGLMLLIFTPVPYVDASSSWALTNKWHRVIIGAAGMWVEFGIAAIAAIVWANTADAHWLHAFCYNIMFIASFSTLIFNANPLLRYDGYYIMSDILEIPNLGQRSKEYLYYLVKRYVWNVKQARSPAYGTSEKGWFVFYAIASFLMRITVSLSIILYLLTVLDGALVLLAAGMAIAAVVGWVLYPIGKFMHYLGTSLELSRVRNRAIGTSAAFGLLVVFLVGIVPFPARARAQGVVEPLYVQEIYPGQDGFVQTVQQNFPRDRYNMPRAAEGDLLLQAENHDLRAERQSLLAERDHLLAKRNKAFAQDMSVSSTVQSDALDKQIAAADSQIANIDERLSRLSLRSPIAGTIVLPTLEQQKFAFLQQGNKLGLVVGTDHLIIRAAVANEAAGPLNSESDRRVEIRLRGRPDVLLTGRIAALYPAGSNKLPSAALGYALGGDLATASDDRDGTKTTERFFEVRIDQLHLESASPDILNEAKIHNRVPLLPGQTVIVRFNFTPKPLIVQAWTALQQLFQRKLPTS